MSSATRWNSLSFLMITLFCTYLSKVWLFRWSCDLFNWVSGRLFGCLPSLLRYQCVTEPAHLEANPHFSLNSYSRYRWSPLHEGSRSCWTKSYPPLAHSSQATWFSFRSCAANSLENPLSPKVIWIRRMKFQSFNESMHCCCCVLSSPWSYRGSC